MTVSGGTASRPHLRVVSAWIDPRDDRVWSGTVSNLIRELKGLGALHSYQDVTPPGWMVRPVRSWLYHTNRLSNAWTLRPEMRLVNAASSAWARTRRPEAVDGWVLPLGAFGRPVRSPFVTWCDMSPRQIASTPPEHLPSFGYPDITESDLRAVVRQQTAILKRAHVCLVVSAWAGRSLVCDHGVDPSRVKVVGAGRNVTVTCAPARDWSKPRYLFLGNNWARKNGNSVVEAFTILRRDYPNAELHLAGDHPRLSVEGIHPHGRLSYTVPDERKVLENLVASSTCLVMPSWIEPFGIVFAEAAHAGVPSIGTTVGGAATAIGQGGILVDPADGAALLAAMRRLARPEVAQALGSAALKQSQAFTWRKCAERVVRAFDPELADAQGMAQFLPDD